MCVCLHYDKQRLVDKKQVRFSNKCSNYFFEDVFLGDEVEKIHSNVQTLQIVGEKEGGGLMSKQPELVIINNTMKFAIQPSCKFIRVNISRTKIFRTPQTHMSHCLPDI